jgi:hypothetical protein
LLSIIEVWTIFTLKDNWNYKYYKCDNDVYNIAYSGVKLVVKVSKSWHYLLYSIKIALEVKQFWILSDVYRKILIEYGCIVLR